MTSQKRREGGLPPKGDQKMTGGEGVSAKGDVIYDKSMGGGSQDPLKWVTSFMNGPYRVIMLYFDCLLNKIH